MTQTTFLLMSWLFAISFIRVLPAAPAPTIITRLPAACLRLTLEINALRARTK